MNVNSRLMPLTRANRPAAMVAGETTDSDRRASRDHTFDELLRGEEAVDVV